jgi:hypothetical protein
MHGPLNVKMKYDLKIEFFDVVTDSSDLRSCGFCCVISKFCIQYNAVYFLNPERLLTTHEWFCNMDLFDGHE